MKYIKLLSGIILLCALIRAFNVDAMQSKKAEIKQNIPVNLLVNFFGTKEITNFNRTIYAYTCKKKSHNKTDLTNAKIALLKKVSDSLPAKKDNPSLYQCEGKVCKDTFENLIDSVSTNLDIYMLGYISALKATPGICHKTKSN